MNVTVTEMAALSRLFSSTVFHEMAKNGRSPLFARLLPEAGLDCNHKRDTVSSVFESAFEKLNQLGVRDEYIYRSAITKNILLGKHSLQDASMLTEFRAGSCKADLVILNGTATVYEIKSDRDKLSRLENQILNYQKVFAKIYVVAGDAHINDIIGAVPEHVGVMSLTSDSHMIEIREAIDRPDQVCPFAIFDSLRLEEVKAILNKQNIDIPDLPNTLLRTKLRELFGEMTPAEVHQDMVATLKTTRNLLPLSDLVGMLPASLQTAALSVRINKKHHDRLLQAVSTPINIAEKW